MKELFTFDDVLIVPKFSDIESRSQVDLSTNIRSLSFKLPIISANMDTVTDTCMATAMELAHAQACLHRFDSIEENVRKFKICKHGNDDGPMDGPMVSIGLGPAELKRAQALFEVGAHTFVIDVAHGAQMAVVHQVDAIRKSLGAHVNVVVGNFASADSVKQFIDYVGTDVDAIKVGVGPGSACTTRIKTGVGYPQLSAILEISQLLKNTDIKVIADGGMKKPGDIAKALGAGAHMVMLGGMLSGTDETPGEILEERKLISSESTGPYTTTKAYTVLKYKKYRGSASQESYEVQGKVGKHRTSEGESFLVPHKGSVSNVLQDIEGGLRSSFTYVGARNLKEFHGRVEFVKVSGSTVRENGAHGK